MAESKGYEYYVSPLAEDKAARDAARMMFTELKYMFAHADSFDARQLNGLYIVVEREEGWADDFQVWKSQDKANDDELVNTGTESFSHLSAQELADATYGIIASAVQRIHKKFGFEWITGSFPFTITAKCGSGDTRTILTIFSKEGLTYSEAELD